MWKTLSQYLTKTPFEFFKQNKRDLLRVLGGIFNSQPNTNQILSDLGSPIKASNIGMSPIEMSTNASLTDGNTYVIAIKVDKKITITGFMFYSVAVASYTADNYNGIGLYSHNNGVISKIAETPNNGNFWINPINSYVQKPLTAPITLDEGLYFVVMLYNSSSASVTPNLLAGAVTSDTVFNPLLPNNLKLYGRRLTADSTLPTTINMSTISPITRSIFVALY